MQRQRTFTFQSQVPFADLDTWQDRCADVLAVNGLMLGGADLSSVDGSTIGISKIDALSLGAAANASGIVLSTSGASSFTPTTDVTTGLGIVANTWYYLYAYNSGSAASPVLSFECASTGPDAAKVFKSGDTSRRYVGSFRTETATTTIQPFTASRGRYQWRFTAMSNAYATMLSGGPCVVLQGTTGVATSQVHLDAMVSPVATMVEVFMQLQGVGGGASSATLHARPSGTPDATWAAYPPQWALTGVLTASTNDFRQQTVEMPIGTDGSLPSHPSLQVEFLQLSGSAAGLILATGYRE